MVNAVSNSLCAFIERTFPRLMSFVSGASGDAVIVAALGIILALALGYRGLQYALSGDHTPHKKARRVCRERPPRRARPSIFADSEAFDASWMVEDKWAESR